MTVHMEYVGTDHFGMPVYCCYRTSGGICGYGSSHEMAFADLEDKENELLPLDRVDEKVDDALHEEAFP